LSLFFETFFEDGKNNSLHGNMIFFSIGDWEQKSCPNELKTRDRGQ